MGKQLIKAIARAPGCCLTGAIARADSPNLGHDAGLLAGLDNLGVAITSDLAAGLATADTLIDFTTPEATTEAVAACQKAKRPLVTGTTGLTTAQQAKLKQAATTIPVLWASNFSLSVNLLFALAEQAATTLGSDEDIDIEILELHHKHKVDAPSGTALQLGERVAKALGHDLAETAVFARAGTQAPRKAGSIGFASLRAGDAIGEHSIIFAMAGERLELTHRSSSRMAFAKGAVHAALWLASQKPGLYDLQNVLAS